MGNYSAILAQHEDIQSRIQFSKAFLKQAREEFAKFPGGARPEVCVFAAGSLGRFETGRISDLDLFILSDGAQAPGQKSLTRLQEIELLSDLIRLNEKLDLPSFSGDGTYLQVHELADLIQATGGARDDSENFFTTRLLLLLESQPLSNDALYEKALQKVLANYFRDGEGREDFVPLFLLNDILRYWRTLCLNYERDRGLEKPWWKKNLNLRFSRKLTVFSTILAIVSGQVKTAKDFTKIAALVPLERLSAALDVIDDPTLAPQYKIILDGYESFLAAKSHAELEEKDIDLLNSLKGKSEEFGDFIHSVLRSPKIDSSLVKYLVI